MIKFYSITKNDAFRLQGVTEKIYLAKDKIDFISWENLTTKWLWFELPETEADHNEFVNKRPTWMRAINAEFRRRKYPIRLYNRFGKGVELKEQGAMSSQSNTNGIKKVSNVFKNVVDDLDGILDSNPEGKRVLKVMKAGYINTATYWVGVIQLSSLPMAIKQATIRMIKKNLPSDDNQLEL